jgi:hypothetical protein
MTTFLASRFHGEVHQLQGVEDDLVVAALRAGRLVRGHLPAFIIARSPIILRILDMPWTKELEHP